MKQILQKLQAELDARGHGACVDNNSRMIVHDDRNIYLYLKESGMTEYVSYGCQHFSLWCECPHTASAKSFCYGILERLPNNYGDKSIQKVSSGVILVKGF